MFEYPFSVQAHYSVITTNAFGIPRYEGWQVLFFAVSLKVKNFFVESFVPQCPWTGNFDSASHRIPKACPAWNDQNHGTDMGPFQPAAYPK